MDNDEIDLDKEERCLIMEIGRLTRRLDAVRTVKKMMKKEARRNKILLSAPKTGDSKLPCESEPTV